MTLAAAAVSVTGETVVTADDLAHYVQVFEINDEDSDDEGNGMALELCETMADSGIAAGIDFVSQGLADERLEDLVNVLDDDGRGVEE